MANENQNLDFEAAGGPANDSIYTASGTVPTSVVATITDTLTFDSGKVIIQNSSASQSFFEVLGRPVYTGLTPYMRFNKNGGLDLLGSNSGDGALRIFSGHPSSQPQIFKVDRFGGGIWSGGTVEIGLGTSNASLKVGSPYMSFYRTTAEEMHRIGTSTGSGNVHYQIFRNGFTFNGKLMVGSSTAIGSEKISLQGSTLVSDKFEIQTTTAGFLMPRMTTAQMNAIAAPDTHLLIFNTDLNGIYRYNGSAWVALSAGYGIIEIIRDSDAGIPTFYADLQTALETCKTSGSNNVVKLHSDISLSAQIDINYGGTGTGNAYKFESLTIDFNGFEVSFDNAGTTNTFNVNLANSTSSNKHIRFLNGVISRLSGTGTHTALKMEATQYGRVSMSGMVVYCENSQAAEIAVGDSTTFNGQRSDFGGSVFVNNASSGYVCSFMSGDNFKVIALGNSNGFRPDANGCKNVYVKCNGTGNALEGGSGNSLKNSTLITNSGRCANVSDFIFDNCKFISTSGYLIYGGVGTIANNCFGETGDNYAIYICGEINHSKFINDSANRTIQFAVENNNSIFINNGSGSICNINASGRKFINCKLISVGGVPVISSGSAGGDLFNCYIESQYNNAAGHGISFAHSSGVVNVSNCVVKVNNASANCFQAGSALNIEATNNTLIGATTAINANVTVNASTDLGNGNRQY